MTAPVRNKHNVIRSGTEDEQIQSLSSLIADLSQSETFWHNAYFWFVAATVIASIAVFLVQHHEASLAKERADAESELNKVKDRKLALELARRDMSISAADERASNANEAAGKANEAAGKANERAATLEATAAGARLKQEQLAKENLQLAQNLEWERIQRLNLQREVSARFVDVFALRDQLSKFAGTVALVEWVGDTPEAKRLAMNIAAGLNFAHWQSPRTKDTAEWDEHPNIHATPVRSVSLMRDSDPWDTNLHVIDPNKGNREGPGTALVEVLSRSIDSVGVIHSMAQGVVSVADTIVVLVGTQVPPTYVQPRLLIPPPKK